MNLRTCQTCRCFEVCLKLQQFCKQMVFTVRRLDVTLIDNLAESCLAFTPVPAENLQLKLSDDAPLLYAVQGGLK